MFNLLLTGDPVGDIARGFIALFVVMLIVPFLKAGIEIYRLVKGYKTANPKQKFYVHYTEEDK